jgi:hypothetical protein
VHDVGPSQASIGGSVGVAPGQVTGTALHVVPSQCASSALGPGTNGGHCRDERVPTVAKQSSAAGQANPAPLLALGRSVVADQEVPSHSVDVTLPGIGPSTRPWIHASLAIAMHCVGDVQATRRSEG